MKHLLRQLVWASLNILADQIVQELTDLGYRSHATEIGSHLVVWVDKQGMSTKSFFLERDGSQYVLIYGNPNNPNKTFNVEIRNNRLYMDKFLNFLKSNH